MLVILTTHPIQYQVPIWQALASEANLDFEVWFLTAHGVKPSFDREFGRSFAWDLDLLAGYRYRFLEDSPNGASPGSFWRCRLRSASRFRRQLREAGATKLWVQGWQVAAYWQAIWAASSIGVEIWLRGETNDLRSPPLWKVPFKRLLLTWLFSKIHHFLYIGSANKRFYERYRIVPERLHPAPYCIDNRRFREQADLLRADRPNLRAAFGLRPDEACVLFCGKLISKKRPFDLVAALLHLSVDVSDLRVHAMFVGTGELETEVAVRCSILEAHKGTRGTLIGFLNQSEIAKAYVAADVMVLPSDAGETWGLVVNEALASGLPCIVSDACGCAEDLIGAVDRNLVFRCGDVEDLARALRYYLQLDDNSALLATVERHSVAATVATVIQLDRSSDFAQT